MPNPPTDADLAALKELREDNAALDDANTKLGEINLAYLRELSELWEAAEDVQITAGEILSVVAYPRRESCIHGTVAGRTPWWCDECWDAFVDSLHRLAEARGEN